METCTQMVTRRTAGAQAEMRPGADGSYRPVASTSQDCDSEGIAREGLDKQARDQGRKAEQQGRARPRGVFPGDKLQDQHRP